MSESSISDHIGRIGEAWFDLLANKAQLLIGRIEPDRIGRDRIIEFPAQARNETEPYDKRPAPLSCSIQIKTILNKSDRVSLKLSVAERLAVDNRPAFICILRVDENDNVVDMHLLHVLGNNLVRVLRRLRREFADGTQALNRVEITFRISAATRVDLNPSALIEALKSLIGRDMNAYEEEKSRQRNEAGYDGGMRYSMNVTFEGHAIKDIIDGMLGLKSLKVKQMRHFEERFKIKLPTELPFADNMQSAVMKVTPTPVDAGVITICNSQSGSQIDFDCDLIIPAWRDLPLESLKVIARCLLLDVIFSKADGSIQLVNTFEESSLHSIEDWFNVHKAWDVLFDSGTEITLHTRAGAKLFVGNSKGNTSTENGSENIRWILSVLDMAKQLLNEAGASHRPVSLRDIISAAEAIKKIHRFFFSADKVGSFVFAVETDELLQEEYQAVFVGTLVLGESVYAYGLKLVLVLEKTEGGYNLCSSSMQPLHLAWVEDDDASVTKFAAHLEKLTGAQMSIIQSDSSSAD